MTEPDAAPAEAEAAAPEPAEAGVCAPEDDFHACEIRSLVCPNGTTGMHVRCISTGMVAFPVGVDEQRLPGCVQIADHDAGLRPEYCCTLACVRTKARDCDACGAQQSALTCPLAEMLPTPAGCERQGPDVQMAADAVCCPR